MKDNAPLFWKKSVAIVPKATFNMRKSNWVYAFDNVNIAFGLFNISKSNWIYAFDNVNIAFALFNIAFATFNMSKLK